MHHASRGAKDDGQLSALCLTGHKTRTPAHALCPLVAQISRGVDLGGSDMRQHTGWRPTLKLAVACWDVRICLAFRLAPLLSAWQAQFQGGHIWTAEVMSCRQV